MCWPTIKYRFMGQITEEHTFDCITYSHIMCHSTNKNDIMVKSGTSTKRHYFNSFTLRIRIKPQNINIRNKYTIYNQNLFDFIYLFPNLVEDL